MVMLTAAQKSALKIARNGNLDRLKELLDGPDLIKDNDKFLAAIREGRWGDMDEHDRNSIDYLLIAAAGGGHPDVLRYLVDRYPYPGDVIPDSAIENAVGSASVETMQVLLDLDPQIVNASLHEQLSGVPLLHAIWLERRLDALRMTEFLLERGADPNPKTCFTPPMEAAILSNWPELVPLLERYGAEPYSLEEELRLLPKAAGSGRLAAVIRLVDKGADIQDSCGENSYTGSPLYNAVYRGQEDVVEYLLRAGADPNKPGPNGKTALQAASGEDPHLKKTVDLVLEYGARA